MRLLRHVLLLTVTPVTASFISSYVTRTETESDVIESQNKTGGQLEPIHDPRYDASRSQRSSRQRDSVLTDVDVRSGHTMLLQHEHRNSSSNESTAVEKRGFSVFDGEDPDPPKHLRECTDVIFKGQCYDHVIKPEGSCFRRHFPPSTFGSMKPDKGVVCDMFPIYQCKYGDFYDYIANFTYPGCGDYANDDSFTLAQMLVGPGAIYCRYLKYNEQKPKLVAHWAHSKGMYNLDN